MNTKLFEMMKRPEPYEEGTKKLWTDEHISKGMLEAHLNTDFDGATRNIDFVKRSVKWIADMLPSDKYPKLLDLGCGPGIYCERFYERGYEVTGVDFSKRSIDYAKESSNQMGYDITYLCSDYLNISFDNEFDVVTLIYCDYGVLSENDRRELLKRVFKALKPGGRFILDVFTPAQYKDKKESNDWEYHDKGFWSEKPHICLNSLHRYDDINTFLRQTIVITEDETESYNIWEHTFECEDVKRELGQAGFTGIDIYGDIAGAEYLDDGTVICAAARKL